MDLEQQEEFFRTRFGRLIPRLQVELFRADQARLNLDVLTYALRQAEGAAKAVGRSPRDPRSAVLAEYERIVASIAQLFPVFFIFESAWRSFLIARLRVVYGGDGWWHPVRDAVECGADPSATVELGGQPVRRELVRTIVHILNGVSEPIGTLATTRELVEAATIGDLVKLIESHWRHVALALNETTSLGLVGWGTFSSLFRRVREARNDMYHHRIVADRARAVAAAEQLLDLLDIHLGTRVEAIAGMRISPLTFAVPVGPRHA